MRETGAIVPSWQEMARSTRATFPKLAGEWLGVSCKGDCVRRNGLSRRLIQLYLGLWLFGTSAALQVRSELGLDPWDVFHQGLARHIDLAIGTVSIIVGAFVLLLWIPLRQWPGLGTLSNVVVIGVAMNQTLEWLPHTGAMALRVGYLAGGIVLCGIATGLYIGARFGPGPRDGLMTGFARRTGRSLRLTRTAIELTVLVAGWALGGTVGVGTVAFALAIGPLAQLFLRLFDTAPPAVGPPVRASARSSAHSSSSSRRASQVARRSTATSNSGCTSTNV
jgi:uncharacterized membrane protein YczE